MTHRILEVIVLDPADAAAAAEGGADRLELIGEPARGGMTPGPDLLRAVLDATPLPVRVMIRREDAFVLSGAGFDQLVEDVEHLPMATEFVLGSVTTEGMPDVALRPVVDAVAGRPWTFHRAIDEAPDLPAAIRQVLGLPGCDQVLTAASSAGVDEGLPRLLPLLADSELAPGVLVGGGVSTQNLAALLEAGAHGIHLGRVVRTDGSWDTPVSRDLVRAAADLVHAG